MVINGLPRSRIMESLGGAAACVMSWAGGGCDPIGLLTPDGWEEIPIVERDEDDSEGEEDDDD